MAEVRWDAVSGAVALLAAEHADADVDQAAIIDGIPPEQVITALILIAGTTLRTAVGREGATGFLRDVGLRVAAEAAR